MEEYGKIYTKTLQPPKDRYLIHVIDKREIVRKEENLEFEPYNYNHIYEYHFITYYDNFINRIR